MVALLFLFMLINFADKAVLGLSASAIIAELHLTHAQFGQVGSSFFLLFSASAVAVGFLIDRVSTKLVLAGMGLVWALVQLPVLFAVGLPVLVANRVLLGAGEGPAFPMALHAVYKWFPDERRPLPTSLIGMGGAVGVGFLAPVITFVILKWSWHAAFGLLGILGLVWTVLWLAIGREGPLAMQAGSAADAPVRISYLRLFASRTMIANALLGFSAYWVLTLAVVWLPDYLHVAQGYSAAKAGWVMVLPSMFQILMVPAVSALSERLKRRGVSSRWARGVVGAGSVALSGALLIVLPYLRGEALPIACVAVAFSCGSTVFTMAAVLVAEICPDAQRGAALGMNNAIATLAGVFAPVTMGLLVDVGADSAAGFRTGFVVVGASVLAAAVAGAVLTNPDEDRRRLIAMAGATAAPSIAAPPRARQA
ncbi:MAG: MFS transporter [Proteobacteria bacterium]|nr:MFS transporter [Pseudomonadota bacterium]